MTQNRNPLIPVYFSTECCMRPVEVIYFVQLASESMEMLCSFRIKQFEKIDRYSFYHYHYYTNNILNTTKNRNYEDLVCQSLSSAFLQFTHHLKTSTKTKHLYQTLETTKIL